jgi:putative SOS response-associated peptidase YedK
MCNRYRLSEAEYAKLVAQGVVPPFAPDEVFPTPRDPWTKFDIWPKYKAPVVHRVDGELTASTMRWGFPTQIKGASGRMLEKHVTNCRNYSSGMWRPSLASPARRCLVPFSEFAEPKPGRDADNKPNNWWFSLPDSPIGMFAGIWRPTETGPVFAFLTTEPNPLVAPLHPKAMPVILHTEDGSTWLDGSTEQALSLAVPFPSQLMRVA